MSGGGSDTPTFTPVDVDQGNLGQFMQSQAGQAYASLYKPGDSYVQSGSTISSVGNGSCGAGRDVTAMMTAYDAWMTGMGQTKTNWENYAATVAANEGGEGDNTITSGPAVGQRQALLGALANAGNPAPTQPTPGLGSMGMPSAMPVGGGRA